MADKGWCGGQRGLRCSGDYDAEVAADGRRSSWNGRGAGWLEGRLRGYTAGVVALHGWQPRVMKWWQLRGGMTRGQLRVMRRNGGSGGATRLG